MKEYFGKVKSIKFEKNYVSTEEKIKNFSIYPIENKFRLRNSKQTPAEYLRQIFKILKHKKKSYVQ